MRSEVKRSEHNPNRKLARAMLQNTAHGRGMGMHSLKGEQNPNPATEVQTQRKNAEIVVYNIELYIFSHILQLFIKICYFCAKACFFMFKEDKYSDLTELEKTLKRFAEKLIFTGVICFFISLFTLCFNFNSSVLMLISRAGFIVMCVCFILGVILYSFSAINHISSGHPFF